MFVRVTKNSSGQAYYHLAESYREQGKVKQRLVAALGRVEDGKLEQLAESIARHTQMMTAARLAESISVDETFVLGPLLVIERLFEKLGIDDALKHVERKHERLEFSLSDVVYSLVTSRMIRPSSKLGVYERMMGRLYPGLAPKDVELQHMYRAMDLLAAHKEDIEQSLYFHGRDLFNRKIDVVLYDLTTLRFESIKQEQALRRFGFSKERRSDCTQVVVGLLISPDGIPLGFEVFPGNTVETKTLKDIVHKVREKFCVRRFILVADRGLLSKDNLDAIRSAEGEFIVGMRMSALAAKRPELYDRNHFRKIAEGFEVFETNFGEDRGIVTWSKQRAERDQKTRNDIVDKIRTKLQSKKKISSKDFVSNPNYRSFLKGLEGRNSPCLDEDKIAAASSSDGFFAIITNVRDKTATDICDQYKELWRIEEAFGEFKGTLRARPIFHWTDTRIIGHLTLCFLALVCEAHMSLALQKAHAVNEQTVAPRPLCAAAVLDALSEVRAIPVRIQQQTVWVRTDIKDNVAKLFRSLGLRIPPRCLPHNPRL